jgi:hypothetical protein
MGKDKLNSLIDLLNKLGPGPISESNKDEVLALLSNCWMTLQGSGSHRTSVNKLHRAEKLSWDGSKLSFILERHGGTVNGSSRADLHYWEVDPVSKHADMIKEGRRQLYPMSPKMNVNAKAKEVADRILAGDEHETLQWKTADHVVVKIGNVIPETYQSTTTDRRRRFRAELERIMLSENWSLQNFGNKIGFTRPNT